MENNLYHLIAQAASELPNGVFFRYNNTSVSYRNALEHIDRFSGYLKERGIEPGDRIFLNIGNTPEFIYALLAASKRGVISVLSNPAYRRYELQYLLNETKPKLVITTHDKTEQYTIDGKYFFDTARIITADKCAHFSWFHDITAVEREHCSPEPLDLQHPAVIIYTSAMTGHPLGALISHRAILETAKATTEFMVKENDVFMTVLPLFHSFGLTSSFFVPLYNRIPLYLVNRFSPRTVLQLLTEQATSIICGVPRMFEILYRMLPEGASFPSMRSWISGGEAISISLQKNYKKQFDIDIRQGYGLTEASPIVTWNMIDKPNVFGSIGTPMPYNEIKLIGKDGTEVPYGSEGEILIRGVNVISGYYKQDAATRRSFMGEWIRSGDLARQDGSGNYFITGRTKEMTIKNGFNIYPKEVARILGYHPSVESAEVNFRSSMNSDGTFDESLAAFIRRKRGRDLDEKSIVQWCRDNICSYKIPDSFTIVS